MTPSADESMESTRRRLRRAFADRLIELRLAAGKPSYAALERKAMSLHSSTMSDVLRGHSNPTLDFVLDFVQACAHYAGEAGRPLNARLLDSDSWRMHWLQLQRDLGTHEGQVDTALADSSYGSPMIPMQLPPDTTVFTGRKAELTRLASILDIDESPRTTSPILLIDGMAGAGKTTLAINMAHKLKEHYPDGQLYADLGGHGPRKPLESSDVLSRFLRALGATAGRRTATDDLAMVYRALTAGKRLLVVLDNAANGQQIRSLLPTSSTCLVIITSRASLSDLTTREGVDDRLTIGPLPRFDSMSLLNRVIGDRVEEDVPGAERLAQLCGDLPLALRIVADYATRRPRIRLSQIAAELSDERNWLSRLQATGGTDGAAVGQVLSWSYTALSPDVQVSFRALGLHPGRNFSRAAAAVLVGQPESVAQRHLDALVSVHLLEETATGQFQLHDLVYAYAVDLALAGGDPYRTRTQQRLLRWYLFWTNEAARLLMPARASHLDLGLVEPDWPAASFQDYNGALQWCDVECENLVSATSLAGAIGEHEIAWKLAYALLPYFNLRKPWLQWIRTFEIAVDSARRTADGYGLANCRNALGIAHRELRHFDEAYQHLTDAAERFDQIDERRGYGFTLLNLGLLMSDHDRFAEAVVYHRQAFALFGEIDNKWGKGLALHNLAESEQELGRYDDSRRHASQAGAICRELDDQTGFAQSLSTIGEVSFKLGRLKEAISHFEQALRIQEGLADNFNQAVTRHRLGRLYLSIGQYDRAREFLRAALATFDHLGSAQAADVLAHWPPSNEAPKQPRRKTSHDRRRRPGTSGPRRDR